MRNKPSTVSALYADRWLLCSVVCLLSIGLLMVASSSMAMSLRQYDYSFHYLIRQSIFIGMGLMLAYLILHIKMENWQRISGYLLLLSILLLILVLIPGIGRVVNGSRRWINLGLLSMQVSEVVKFCFIIYLSSYLVRHAEEVQNNVTGFIKPMLLLAGIALLLLLEPDFGASAVIAATTLCLMFLAGVRLWQFCILVAVSSGALAILAVSAPYRVARLTSFLHPWANPFDSGYQLTQSLIAFGRGGLFGTGLGDSIQKLFYLPEAHTDFLFAVLAEELGLVGELTVIALFTIFITRALHIGRRAASKQHFFSAYVAYGIGLWLGMQAIVNIGVTTGLLPTKGLTLPLMSYGGSSMLITLMAIGVLLRIAFENQGDKVRQRRRR